MAGASPEVVLVKAADRPQRAEAAKRMPTALLTQMFGQIRRRCSSTAKTRTHTEVMRAADDSPRILGFARQARSAPRAMLERSPTPPIAAEAYTDNKLGEERLHMGQDIGVLECKLDSLMAWILEKPAQPCEPTK